MPAIRSSQHVHLQPAVPERANKDVDLAQLSGESHFLDEGVTCEKVDLTKAAGASHFLAEGATCKEVNLTKSAGEEGASVFLCSYE
jgi:hypothetical protein